MHESVGMQQIAVGRDKFGGGGFENSNEAETRRRIHFSCLQNLQTIDGSTFDGSLRQLQALLSYWLLG